MAGPVDAEGIPAGAREAAEDRREEAVRRIGPANLDLHNCPRPTVGEADPVEIHPGGEDLRCGLRTRRGRRAQGAYRVSIPSAILTWSFCFWVSFP